ncbi:hypothetical protein OE88DRAFT_643325 [Heliocybe sulcata]|uniref:Uncharacterized protein n=1 Tax=Heliocybe sulcata TaxID=5364 RepID=A0A5C3NFE0_9AGAM|nr:hypothetical protein OE88DRAFT_643325 [Heliocybe sulcata]
MGKWTVDYCDDVLHAKLKGLLQGAIKRSKLEQGQPTISYETFVDELDEGDSFTASLMDILVKELADRRTRSHEADHHLVCDATAKGLRSLASTSSVYRPHTLPRYASRRNINLAEYLAVPPDRMDLEAGDHVYEEDFVALANSPPPRSDSTVREARDIYDAYLGSRLRPQTASSSREQSDEPPENNPVDDAPRVVHRPMMGWLSPRTDTRRSPSASSGPSLARQGPIRRLRRNAADDSSATFGPSFADRQTREEPLNFPSSEAALRARNMSAPSRRLEIHLPSWRHGSSTEDVTINRGIARSRTTVHFRRTIEAGREHTKN